MGSSINLRENHSKCTKALGSLKLHSKSTCGLGYKTGPNYASDIAADTQKFYNKQTPLEMLYLWEIPFKNSNFIPYQVILKG